MGILFSRLGRASSRGVSHDRAIATLLIRF